MATISQIRGLMLEEIVLYLLQYSGYKTVSDSEVNFDDTLCCGHSGIEVKGRGCNHQIDAIADCCISIPFSNPQRLLVEAKCYKSSKKIGVKVLRNAVGVRKDVSEFWSANSTNSTKRYHYLYAVFSTSDFTKFSEAYAFVHDIFLFPLGKSRFFKPIINSLFALNHEHFSASKDNSIEINPKNFRKSFRKLLNSDTGIFDDRVNKILLHELANICRNIRGLLLGMIDRRFPIIMTPNSNFHFDETRDSYQVRMYGDYNSPNGWDLEYQELPILSFDIPSIIFNKYAESKGLTLESAKSMKESFFKEIQAIVYINSQVRIITFNLDMVWLSKL